MQIRMKSCLKTVLLALCGFFSLAAVADIVVPMHHVDEEGVGLPVGQVTVSESLYGLVFTPALIDLEPGAHGFHVHQNPDCSQAGGLGKGSSARAAGGHYDPEKTRQHGAPWKNSAHKGDLPMLFVNEDGSASQPVLAPRLHLSELSGRSLIVHAGSDNYSDHPALLGGGGARIACGIFPEVD